MSHNAWQRQHARGGALNRILFALFSVALSALIPVVAEDAAADHSVVELLQLAEKGDTRAAFLLGSRFAARGGEEDEVAVQWFRVAADGGLAEAQYNLGFMLSQGRGGARDDGQAAAWFRRAADQDFPAAQFNLGSFYASGRGVQRDDATAAAWFERAAEQGLAPAQHNLGLMYEYGRGVPMDRERALAWYGKAAAQGFTAAARERERLLSHSPGVAASPSPPPAAAVSLGTAREDLQAWVLRQPTAAFTLQLASFQVLAEAKRFVATDLQGRAAGLYSANKRGSRWYSVVLGSFASSDAARRAVQDLPPNLRQLKPWVRRFGTIHAEMSAR